MACPVLSDYNDITKYSLAFKNYLNNLLSWSDANKYFKIISNKEIEDVLHQTGAYPFWDSITTALQQLNLTEDYPAKDIVKLIDSILSKCERIEDIIQIDDVICIASSHQPVEALAGRNENFISHFERIFGLIEIDANFQKRLGVAYGLVSSCACDISGRVGVIGEVLDYQVEGDIRPITVPHKFESKSIAAPCLLEMIKRLDYDEVWRRGSVEACSFAIEISIIQNSNLDFIEVAELRDNWFLGFDFYTSLLKLDLLNNELMVEKIVRAIRETILREKLDAVHILRKNSGGNSQGITKGKYKAQRRDIDRTFHLHYWDNGKKLEIANVVIHDDFAIS